MIRSARSFSRSLRLSTLAALVLATPGWPAPREIKITGNDAMQYSVKRIEAAPGEALRVVLSATGAMPKAEMAHNFVLLAKGTDLNAFVMAAASARKTGYIPASKKSSILAMTEQAGAGETVEVTFTAPKEPGEYAYICTFPGHFVAGMKGVLIVR